MLDKKESRYIITQLINEGKITKPKDGTENFFFEKSRESLDVARRILEISQNKTDNLESYMWAVSTAYYSMFYAATSLLAHFSKKIDTEIGIHKLTYHALVHYFYGTDNKLQKHFLESYKDIYHNAEELLQFSEDRAVELLEHFKFEQSKRKIFTYEIGEVAKEAKAKTSVKRAEDFYNHIREILEK